MKMKRISRFQSLFFALFKINFSTHLLIFIELMNIFSSYSFSLKNNCDTSLSTFELYTGYFFSSSMDTIATLPGTLKLTECLSHCRNNPSCRSINFETGLCVLFNSSALEQPHSLKRSQFPVFTLYGQNFCSPRVIPSFCKDSWLFETVPDHRLEGYPSKTVRASDRVNCMIKCHEETEFQCRSASYSTRTGECSLSEMDRHAVASTNSGRQFKMILGSDYLESNCVDEPKRICEFKSIKGKVLKTVDSVFTELKTYDECQSKCLQSEYRCFSFDLGSSTNRVCRISHLDSSSLSHIKEAYTSIDPEAITYELSSCYDINIVCRSEEMIAKVRTNRIFRGKIYEKSKPYSCINDVDSDLHFDLRMNYGDEKCNVRKSEMSKYSSDIVIQHHDSIVTSKDVGLSIQCSYNLNNRTVINSIQLESDGDVIGNAKDERYIHSTTVESPNVTVTIVDDLGGSVRKARIGDRLTIQFEIIDNPSPYEIFIRSLVASDGRNSGEMELIGDDGCPRDIAIMGPVTKAKANNRLMQTTFEAFKFPSTNSVQFRAIVTPCLARCQPIHCYSEGFDGSLRSSYSYGRRRKRSVSIDHDKDMILQQTIIIQDTFSPEPEIDGYMNGGDNVDKLTLSDDMQNHQYASQCMSKNFVFLIFIILLLTQLGMSLTWNYLRRSLETRERVRSYRQNFINFWENQAPLP